MGPRRMYVTGDRWSISPGKHRERRGAWAFRGWRVVSLGGRGAIVMYTHACEYALEVHRKRTGGEGEGRIISFCRYYPCCRSKLFSDVQCLSTLHTFPRITTNDDFVWFCVGRTRDSTQSGPFDGRELIGTSRFTWIYINGCSISRMRP